MHCPDQFFGVCGGKGSSIEICASAIADFSHEDSQGCSDYSNTAFRGEDKDSFCIQCVRQAERCVD